MPDANGNFTTADLVALTKAIASGARSVSYDGRSVTYGSLDEMWALRRQMQVALGLASPSRTILAMHDRGFSRGTEG